MSLVESYRLALALFAVVTISATTGAQVRKLSGPPVTGISGDVTTFALSPDGRTAVYRADQERDEVFELYRVSILGGRSTKRSGALVPGGNVTRFQISPDSKHIVYLADQDTDEVFELYSAAADGSAAPVKLSGALVDQGDVAAFQISPDAKRVLFHADRDTNDLFELYAVPIQGGAVNRLNDPLIAGGSVRDFRISPDGERVVYRASQEVPGSVELYGVAAAGGAVVKLSMPFATDGSVESDYRIDARSLGAFYRTHSAERLQRVPLEGGASTALAAGVQRFELSPDASRVVYVSDPDLYSIPAHGGTAVRINHPLAFEQVAEYAVSPDSTRVAYSLQGGDSNYGLFSVPIEGGLVHEFPTDEGELFGILITPDSSRVVYYLTNGSYFSAPLAGGERAFLFGDADIDVMSGFSPDSTHALFVQGPGLFSVPLGGGAPTRLNPAPVPGGSVSHPLISADSSRVAYLAEQEADDVTELFVVALAGGPTHKLNSTLVAGGTVSDVRWAQVSADERHILFVADQERDEVVELFRVELVGGASRRLNGPLVAGGDVLYSLPSPDSRHVVYVADQDQDEVAELFSVPLSGAGHPLRLNAPLEPGSDVLSLRISPDSRSVVYVLSFPGPRYQLLAVPIAGGPSVELSPAPGSGASAFGFGSLAITADSSRVVYIALEQPSSSALYSVSISGGPVTKLGPEPVPGSSVYSFALLPDGSGVVYAGDLDTDQVIELYLSPLGGGPATKLNAPLLPGSSVYTFQVSADSSHVVYQEANQTLAGVRDVYSVRLAGLTRGRLNPPLASNRAVSGFKLSADSTRVVYRSDQDRNDVFELFSVPIGGGLPQRLNAPLAANEDVGSYPFDNSFALSPDSRRVVYRADQDQNDVFELYTASIDGTGAPVKLNGTLVPRGRVDSFRISSDSLFVFYLATQEAEGVLELFRAYILGGQVQKLNAPLVPNGNVADYLPLRAGILYWADQDLDETVELYTNLRGKPGLRALPR